ncbi:MAG: hypothetical protein ACREAA_04060 [Candidatus Polarisedimenticolia bacterium]
MTRGSPEHDGTASDGRQVVDSSAQLHLAAGLGALGLGGAALLREPLLA